ncbi:MAG TPA: L-seryl-tRNA(Sec) selenium transferase, partial [Acidobacteria bacterium]|nr:L-seryl-tRNA(Sec) selenium transferase [Acidobacteriota bacterium]
MASLYRQLPAVHQLLQSESLREAADRHGRKAVVAACQRELDRLRAMIRNREISTPEELSGHCDRLAERIATALDSVWNTPYVEVLNATGVLLHTNLGRAPAGAGASPPAGYLALEYDLASGRRGQRLDP